MTEALEDILDGPTAEFLSTLTEDPPLFLIYGDPPSLVAASAHSFLDDT
jgi:hypothetical protein